MVTLALNLILILGLTTIHCKAGRSIEKMKSSAKGDCVPLGGLCENANNCCGRNDPETGHCLGCWQHGGMFVKWGRHRCGCDVTGRVGRDFVTHVVLTDMCNGLDSSGARCATRVAPPGDSSARGKKTFWYVN